MPCLVTVGGFYGDEGKGKIIAYLAKKDNPAVAVRGGVGPNAGHTFTFEGKEYKVRMLPSAVLNPTTRLLVGAGVLVNPQVLIDEIAKFHSDDRTFVDSQCGIIEQIHIERDIGEDYLKSKVGTTGTGTGPANADRALRRLKLARDIPELSLYMEDVSNSVNYALHNNETVIVEGTQGTYLSLFHGGYPYVTSSDVTASGICSHIGIGPKRVDEILVVFKAYVTRVGGGPLENELSEEEASQAGRGGLRLLIWSLPRKRSGSIVQRKLQSQSSTSFSHSLQVCANTQSCLRMQKNSLKTLKARPA
jgi:adenylosuccinate synthase